MADGNNSTRRQSTRIRRESAVKREAEEESPRPTKIAKPPQPKAPPKTKAAEKSKYAPKTKPKQPQRTQSVETTPVSRVDLLPSRINDGKPLPTLTKAPTEYGPEYQSVKDSGVIAAALARSRKQWMTDGVFERFWAKSAKPPPKKKADPVVTTATATSRDKNKPPGDKIGVCKMVVEPHVFDVTFYAIYEIFPATASSHGGPVRLPPPASHGQSAPVYQPPYHAPAPPKPLHQASSPAPAPRATPSTTIANRPPAVAQATPSSLVVADLPAPAPAAGGGDPVIQMLAHRASTNPELKSVMKIVATGGANPSQLTYFQKHIDEFHEIIAEQKARDKPGQKPASKPAPKAKPPPAKAAPRTAPTASHGYNTLPPGHFASNSAPSTLTHGPPQSFQHQPYHAPVPAPARRAPAPPPPPPPAQKIKTLLLEFDREPTSRWLFPANAILEHDVGSSSCIVSFLAQRKAKDAEDAARYVELAKSTIVPGDGDVKAEDVVFWQPVTVQFECGGVGGEQLIDSFRAVVRPIGEVARWMERTLNGEEEKAGAGKDKQADGVAHVAKEIGEAAGAGAEAGAEPGKVKHEALQVDRVAAKSELEPGRRRAESRTLAVRLPKEEKTIEVSDG